MNWSETGGVRYAKLANLRCRGCSCKAPDDECYEGPFQDGGTDDHDPLPRAHLAARHPGIADVNCSVAGPMTQYRSLNSCWPPAPGAALRDE